jgi:hypothetical protein
MTIAWFSERVSLKDWKRSLKMFFRMLPSTSWRRRNIRKDLKSTMSMFHKSNYGVKFWDWGGRSYAGFYGIYRERKLGRQEWFISETRNVNFKSWIGRWAKDHFFGISLDHHKGWRCGTLTLRLFLAVWSQRFVMLIDFTVLKRKVSLGWGRGWDQFSKTIDICLINHMGVLP